MKKWNNAKLYSLGVEMTFGKGDHHYCHAPEGLKCDTANGGSDHNASAGADHRWSGNACHAATGTTHGNDKGNSDCCCYGKYTSILPDVPILPDIPVSPS